MKRLLLIGLAVAALVLVSASPASAAGYGGQGNLTSSSKTGGAVSACPNPGTSYLSNSALAAFGVTIDGE